MENFKNEFKISGKIDYVDNTYDASSTAGKNFFVRNFGIDNTINIAG